MVHTIYRKMVLVNDPLWVYRRFSGGTDEPYQKVEQHRRCDCLLWVGGRALRLVSGRRVHVSRPDKGQSANGSLQASAETERRSSEGNIARGSLWPRRGFFTAQPSLRRHWLCRRRLSSNSSEGRGGDDLQGRGELYEAPNGVHLVSANASSTEPAKLVAYLICDRDVPLSVDVRENIHLQGSSR